MKTRLVIIVGIIIISVALFFTSSYDFLDSEDSAEYTFEIKGEKKGTGKADLIFTRTNIESKDVHAVDLTKDLHYTDLTKFTQFQINDYGNYLYVSWLTVDHSWSDVFLAVSNDNGKTFDVKNISQTQKYVSDYQIDFYEETVYVIWPQEFTTDENRHLTHLTFTKSDNYGKSFGEQKIMSSFDTTAFENDLEAFDENVIIVWRQDTDSPDEKNVWFATSTDKAEWFDREAKLFGARVDVESLDGILHFTGLSERHDAEIWYAYSDDVGQTLHKKIIFDADWKLSPYADRPHPKITFDEGVFVEFEIRNEDGEKIPYKIPVMEYVIISKGSVNSENQFHLIPEDITVILGKNNTVTWINEDDVPHILVSDDQNYSWSTGLMKPGESSSVTFDKTGVFSYHGTPGPWITGSITVVNEY